MTVEAAKLRLRPVRTEGVYQVLEDVACLRDHIKAARLKRWALDAYIGLGNPSNLLLLARTNRVESIAVLIIGSAADLDKDELFTISGHDVQFTLLARVVRANDRVVL